MIENMQTAQLEFDLVTDDRLAGFRLHRFELFNWGTFDKAIWHIAPNGENTLLTGDIGSGKSTLVDALTTLLVPAQKITYNKAAGAESKERNLISYIRGYYKSEKDSENLSARGVALRDKNNYSVLLGYFYNQGYDTRVTLAQVFWCKEEQSQPERFYLVSTEELSIQNDFSNFGDDISDLKKRLKRKTHNEIFDSFVAYSAEFRRRLGIESEQALDLFYQTVSMKSVGNLTEFVRQHMLEAPPVQERVESICREFDNLNRAHEAVLKAKAQIELLQPLLADYQQHQQVQQHYDDKAQCREALEPYFAEHKAELLQQRISDMQIKLEKHQQKVQRQQQDMVESRDQRDQLKQSIEDNGGRRLETLAVDIQRLEHEQQQKKTRAQTYQDYCQAVGLTTATDSDSFLDNRLQAQALLTQIEQQQQTVNQDKEAVIINRNGLDEKARQLQAELESLKARRSNIPLSNLQIRQQLATAIDVPTDKLPFIGELIKVDETESEWEGAVERVLHNFGLSLLVADEHYEKVAHYVDITHLRGRLVYFRVKDLQAEHFATPDAHSLFHKIRIKTDSPFYDWLSKEIAQRFDYYCAEDLTEFRRQPKAITQQGQIKSSVTRHEKDDRYAINDRSQFVLGWDNRAKIARLEQDYAELLRRGKSCLEQLNQLDVQLRALQKQRDKARDLLNIESFNEIDWQSFTRKIDSLLAEKRQIEQDSDILKHLQNRLAQTIQELRDKEAKYDLTVKEGGKLEANLESDNLLLQRTMQTVVDLEISKRQIIFPKLRTLQASALPNVTLTIATCDENQSLMRKWLQTRMDGDNAKLKQLGERVTSQMQNYKSKYPQETREVDASLQAAGEFGQMLKKLQSEDLPRHEQRFHQMLKEGTIQKIAMFRANLEKEKQDIIDKLERINRSLSAIDYHQGTYIKLICEATLDNDIREFQQNLRACLADTLSGDENLYDEAKFHEVKKIIDRFKGREGLTDSDKKWTQKVTDVRNWFLFSASERWREDDQEKEYYSDSAGKSGGQKEKLAYTILASALAYQFGLEWGETKSRSFRFVMIDEAFGRGSDDSARYGLELFSKLNLQLLIVTPLQKIHVIENYVKSVNLVHNEGGKKSMLRNLTISEYKAEKNAK
jgi:uncharacterized protein YPO0396